MDRESFEFVFIHANSLAELGLQQVAAELEQQIVDQGDTPQLSAQEREAKAQALLAQHVITCDENGDYIEPEEVKQRWAEVDALRAQSNADSAQQARIVEQHRAAEAAFWADKQANASAKTEASETGFELAQYLHNAYAARAQISAQVEEGMARIDLEELEMLLGCLPPELPLITQALSVEEFQQCLDCYQSDDFGMTQIVSMVRALAG